MPKLQQKTFICDTACEDWGKTTFIKTVDQMLSLHSNRFRLVFQTSGVSDIFRVYEDLQNGNRQIVISSAGDEKKAYNKIQKYLKSHDNVWAVICASRSKSTHPNSTWSTIKDIARVYSFLFVAYSNFYIEKSLFSHPLTNGFNDELATIIYNSL